jgi:hypothetical protein
MKKYQLPVVGLATVLLCVATVRPDDLSISLNG